MGALPHSRCGQIAASSVAATTPALGNDPYMCIAERTEIARSGSHETGRSASSRVILLAKSGGASKQPKSGPFSVPFPPSSTAKVTSPAVSRVRENPPPLTRFAQGPDLSSAYRALHGLRAMRDEHTGVPTCPSPANGRLGTPATGLSQVNWWVEGVPSRIGQNRTLRRRRRGTVRGGLSGWGVPQPYVRPLISFASV